MDLIGEYFYVILLILGAVAQWVKSRNEAKAEAEQAKRRADQGGADDEYFDLEDILERAAHESAPRPAVPPPLPTGPMPGVERSPAPDLRRKNTPPPPVASYGSHAINAELARQNALAEQVALLQQAKKRSNGSENAAAAKARSGFSKTHQVSPSTSLKQRLLRRDELRKGFVLKEILEKPVGLR